MRTVIIGLGNPILGDDGIGIEIARRIERKISRDETLEIRELSAGGLGLLENILGFDKAVIIDSVVCPEARIGRLHKLNPNDIGSGRGLFSAHQVGFPEALRFGREIGMKVPAEISIYAVEIGKVENFSRGLSGEIRKRIPAVVGEILRNEFRERE